MSNNWPSTGTPQDIGQHIVHCVDQFLNRFPSGNAKNWDDLQNRLLRWVQNLDQDVAFSGLVWILENQTRYQYQLLAGELLNQAALKSPMPLPELLGRIVPTFELSAKTVPRFLSNLFGRDAVVECLREMRQRSSTQEDTTKVETMLFWLGDRSLPK